MFNTFAVNTGNQYERTLAKFAKAREAMVNVNTVMVVENSGAKIDPNLKKVNKYLKGDASNAYGFTSQQDRALVVNYESHKRKPENLEGSIDEQGEDTVNHEIGHFVGNEFSQTSKFKNAYYADLKRIESALKSTPNNDNLKATLKYLKHYTEGADFSKPISEKDVTSTGLKENFAECFSMIADDHPSTINEVFRELFPNSMRSALEFVA